MTGPIQAHLIAAGKYHDIDFARLELLKLMAEEPRIRATVAMDYANVARLAECDFLVTYTCDVLPAADEVAALQVFLARGGRWLALHGTNSILRFLESGLVDSPDEAPELMEMLGSQFVAHPPIGAFTVEVLPTGDPLTRGLVDFEIVDELYLSRTTAPIETLMLTRFTGDAKGFVAHDWHDAEVPILYRRKVGRGEIVYCTLGHCRGHYDVAVFTPFWPHPERCGWNYPVYYEILRRGLRWAAGTLE
jgi:type 1 glutamine amidotransferase